MPPPKHIFDLKLLCKRLEQISTSTFKSEGLWRENVLWVDFWSLIVQRFTFHLGLCLQRQLALSHIAPPPTRNFGKRSCCAKDSNKPLKHLFPQGVRCWKGKCVMNKIRSFVVQRRKLLGIVFSLENFENKYSTTK